MPDRRPALRCGPASVGIISNYADAAVDLRLVSYLRSVGVGQIVYSGPISILEEPLPLWRKICDEEVRWVYGRAERPRSAPEVGELPSGPETLEVNGIFIRHFVPDPHSDRLIRFGELQWPPPGAGQKEAVEAAARAVENRIVVIGSGLEYERWAQDGLKGEWDMVEQNVPGYADTPVVRIALPEDVRTVIIHPTSRSSYCSVIDAERNTMTLLML